MALPFDRLNERKQSDPIRSSISSSSPTTINVFDRLPNQVANNTSPSQAQKELFETYDEKVKAAGWMILRSEEAYEHTIYRNYYFRKGKNTQGESADIYTANERVVYLFRESRYTWTAWAVKWQGKDEPASERNIVVNRSFNEAFSAAMRYINRVKKWMSDKKLR